MRIMPDPEYAPEYAPRPVAEPDAPGADNADDADDASAGAAGAAASEGRTQPATEPQEVMDSDLTL